MKELDHQSSILDRVMRLLSPPVFPNDEDKSRLVYRLNAMSLVGICITLIYIAVWLVILPDDASWLKWTLPILTIFIGVIVLIRLNRFESAAGFFLSSMWLVITLLALSAGGPRAPMFGFYIVIVLNAVVVSSWRYALFYGILTFFASCVMTHLANIGAITPPSATPMSAWLTQTAIMFFVTLFGYIIVQDVQRSLSQMRLALVEQGKIEASLRESEERFRLISSVTSDYTFSVRFDLQGKLESLLMTGAYEEITGYTPAEFMAMGSWRTTIHPDDLGQDDQDFAALHANQRVLSEIRIIKKGGEVRWIRVNAKPVWDSERNHLAGINGGVRDITERKQTENALRESEKRYRVISEMISDYAYAYEIHDDDTFTPIWITDESFERLTQYQWDEIGASYKLYHPEDVEKVIEDVNQTIHGKPISGEYRILTKSGEIRWLYIRRVLEWDEDKKRPVRLYGSAEDITERKRAALAVQLSEQRYRGAITAAGLVPYVIEYKEKRFSFIGDDIFKLTGYTPEEITPLWLRENILEEYTWKNHETVSPDEARDQVLSGIAMEWHNDFRILTRTGESRWISDASVPVVDEYGKAVGAIGIMQDITDRKRTEDEIRTLNVALNEKAAQLSVLNEIAHDISALTDLTSTLNLILAKLQTTLAFDMFFVALHHPDTQTLTFPLMYDSGRLWNEGPSAISESLSISQVLQSGQPLLINRTKERIAAGMNADSQLGDVNRVSASILMAPLPLGNKNIGVISIQSYALNYYNEKHIDLLMGAAYQIAIAVQNARLYDSLQNELTARRRLEAQLQEYANKLEKLVDERTNALRRAKEQFELILNNTTNALAFADPDGNILVTNPAFRTTFTQLGSQSIELILWSLANDEQVGLVSNALVTVIYDNETQRVEAQIISNDGREKDVDLTFIPVNVSDVETRNGVLVSGHDITQLKEIERFKARFVADAVHDLATPIAGLSSRLYLLKRNPERLVDHVRALENQIGHLRSLLDDLRTLSQIDRGQLALNVQRCNINMLVQRVFDIYEPVALDKQQLFTQQTAPALPEVLIDPRQIERVLVNLVSNAINYTPSHKAITIETSLEEQSLVIRVVDQGIGISSEDLTHIFDRFYRATEARENLSTGTGLGLAITKEIVEMHGGSIIVTTEQGKGSTFMVRLPLHS